MHLYRNTTKNISLRYTKPPAEVDRAWPVYVMRLGPCLVRLIFANEKACRPMSC